MELAVKNLAEKLDYISDVMRNNGPEEAQYQEHLEWYNQLNHEIQNGIWTKEEIDQMRDLFGKAYKSTETLQGFVFVKPHGYAGDFEVIEKIYGKKVNRSPLYSKFDLFFQAQSAPNAVRNRKEYFKKILKEKLAHSQKKLRVLNLASGPCRGIKEYLAGESNHHFQIDCIDVDAKAIQHAKSLLEGSAGAANVRFVQENIFRFKPTEQYDLIWSAGLFDYFDDKTFSRILSRYKDSMALNG
ncbi:MAG: class I SAM-dependent methyltransferase [Bacteroidota bacterium]